MKLVIGGPSGKERICKRTFFFSDKQMIDGKDAEYEDIFHCTCLYHFHEWIKKGLEQEWDFENIAEKIQERNPDLIVISNELGYVLFP